jgi:hypothetical protein
VQAPDGWLVLLHEMGESIGAFDSKDRAAGIADVFNRMCRES